MVGEEEEEEEEENDREEVKWKRSNVPDINTIRRAEAHDLGAGLHLDEVVDLAERSEFFVGWVL